MNKKIIYITIIIFFIGCKGEDGAIGPSGLNSLVLTTDESAGANCKFGGVKIETGLDNNANGILETGEITKTDYVCRVAASNSLIKIEDEPAGSMCASGGLKINAGLDTNGDGNLDEQEIDQISFVCNSGLQIVRISIQVGFLFRIMTSEWTETSVKDEILVGFNIDNYKTFDQMYFLAQFDRGFGGESTDSLGIRLFDHTNNVEIANSEVWSTIPNSVFNSDPPQRVFQSDNFISSISSGTIDIGMQMKKQDDITDDRSISIHNAEILLIKSD